MGPGGTRRESHRRLWRPNRGFSLAEANGVFHPATAELRGEDVVVVTSPAAAAKSFDTLLAEHLDDYRALFDRVTLDLGASSPLPTDERILAYARDRASDPGLEALLFHYGRYLLIASSRDGGLPANLQGKWNNSNQPPWRGDNHSNINVQMNYWPAEGRVSAYRITSTTPREVAVRVNGETHSILSEPHPKAP